MNLKPMRNSYKLSSTGRKQLNEVKQGIKSKKLEAGKTEAKAAFVAKVGSLFGSNKLKEEREELQRRISALEYQNKVLIQHIKTMEQKHKEERTKFNEYMDKIQQYFPSCGDVIAVD